MAETLRLRTDRLRTPIGEVTLAADAEGRLRVLDWTDHQDRLQRLLRLHYGAGGYAFDRERNPAGLTTALAAYFDGDLRRIDGLPVATGGTPFQRAVWAALREIPCGATVAYADIARRIGRPSAVRAVGLANGANPIGVVVPCHRVIGRGGALTGYGGGLDRKRWLLAHEAAGKEAS